MVAGQDQAWPPNENGKSNFEKFVERVEAHSEGVNQFLALLFRFGNAVKGSIFFVAFLVVLIVFLRVII